MTIQAHETGPDGWRKCNFDDTHNAIRYAASVGKRLYTDNHGAYVIGDFGYTKLYDLVPGQDAPELTKRAEAVETVRAIHSFLKGRLNADGTITLTPAEISKLGGLIGQPIA